MHEANAMTTEHSWSVAEGEMGGVPVFVRLRDDVQTEASSGRYRWWLRVVWQYEAEDEYGLPSDEELDEMSDFEEVLEATIEAGDEGLMVFVMTHSGVRQWLFYSSDLNASIKRLEGLAKSTDPRIAISTAEDADWSEYRGLAARIGAEEE